MINYNEQIKANIHKSSAYALSGRYSCGFALLRFSYGNGC